MNTDTGEIYTTEQLEKLLNTLSTEDQENLVRKLVSVSDEVALKMQLGNKAYKKRQKKLRHKEIRRRL